MSDNMTRVLAPALPESVDEANLLSWHVQVGEAVSRDQLLAEVETDKVVLEVVALCAGTIAEILVEAGDPVEAGQVLVTISEGDVDAAATTSVTVAPSPAAEFPAREGPAARRRKRISSSSSPATPLVVPAETPSSAPAEKGSPAQAASSSSSALPAAVPPLVVSAETVSPAPAPAGDEPKRVAMSRLRVTIARRMQQARHQTAMLTTFNEVDMTALMDVRKSYREDFEQKHGVRLGYLPFFVRACVRALREFPLVNAAIDGEEMLIYEQFHIGIAVASERGLVVPVLRDVGDLSLAAISQQITALSEKARKGRLLPDDLRGGTFTISNGGVFGSLLSTPILNPPQSAILGMHRIQERPVALDGQVVVRPMMYLALSYDHRLVDGREAVGFLIAIRDAVQDPVRLLLEV